MSTNIPVYIGSEAISRLVAYAGAQNMRHLTLVADQNTYAVLGERVEGALKQEGFDVKTVVLQGAEVTPDEYYIMQVLLQAGKSQRIYLAVGSGTLTDITRFVSHRTRTDFISVPTAPSVDGFASVGAPLVVGKWKQTVPAQPPIAIFADELTLRNAPRPMIAAGFGDMLGKYTALADWKLGGLLWDEPYSDDIAGRAWAALTNCVRHADAIGRGEEEGICAQMEGLIVTGLSMVEAASSRPAGGSEHHISHFLEMKLLREGRPPVFHGAKVGVACTLMAQRYAKLRQMSKAQAAERLAASALPERDQEIERMRRVLGPLAEQAIREQAPFLDMTAADYERLKRKVLDRWDEIQAIAGMVPGHDELVARLKTVGAAPDMRSLGLSDEEVALAQEYAHYLRNRFTVLKLGRMLEI